MVILRTITTNNAQWQHLIKVMTHYGFEESWAPKMFREKKIPTNALYIYFRATVPVQRNTHPFVFICF